MRRSMWLYALLIAFGLSVRSLLCGEGDEVKSRSNDIRTKEDNDASYLKKKHSKYFRHCFHKDVQSKNQKRLSSSSCFGHFSRKKYGTQLDSKETEQLLVKKLLKHWRRDQQKLKAPRKLCSKLSRQKEGTKIYGFFSSKYIRIVQNDKVDYELHRVQLSDQNEGGKDMSLLACSCDIINVDSDSDSLPTNDVEDDDNSPEKNEFNQPYGDPPEESTDVFDIFYGPRVSVDRLSEEDSIANLPRDGSQISHVDNILRRKAHNRKFSRGNLSQELSEIASPPSSPDPETSTPSIRNRPSTTLFRRRSLEKSRQFEEFPSPSNNLEVAPRLSRVGFSSHESQFIHLQPEVTELPRPSKSSKREFSSSESQFSDFQENFTPARHSRSLDYTKLGIQPIFNRLIINRAKDVPAANVCVDGKMYVSKGVDKRKSFFLYAKNLENNTFNVIGHFTL